MLPTPYFVRNIVLVVVVAAAIYAAHSANLAAISHLPRAFIDSLHAPGFALVASAALLLRYPRIHAVSGILTISFYVFLVAVLGEASQILGPRDADIKDLLMDVVGIAYAATIAALLLRKPRRPLRSSFIPVVSVCAILLTIATFGGTFYYAHAIWRQQSMLPAIADFEQSWQKLLFSESERYRVNFVPAPVDWPAYGRSVAKLALGSKGRIGIELVPSSDWRGSETLSFTASSAGRDPVLVSFRVHDANHIYRYNDRFNTQIEVAQQPQTYRFSIKDISNAPDKRSMDVSRIVSIIWFIADPVGNEVIYIDDVRLSSAKVENNDGSPRS